MAVYSLIFVLLDLENSFDLKNVCSAKYALSVLRNNFKTPVTVVSNSRSYNNKIF